ncbi:MAG: hypothetical protein AAF399_26640 [Bacteroidota bacterium]
MNFKYFLVFLSLFSFASLGFAQNDNVGLFISLRGAASVPTAQFKSDASDGGSAITGLGGSVEAGIRFTPNFSVSANWLTFDNPIADGAVYLPQDGPWRSNFVMVKFNGHLPLGNRVTLDGGLMAGPAWVRFPQGEFTLDDLNPQQVDQRSGGFGLGGHFAVNYHIDQFISFQLGTSYLAANPDFDQSGQVIQRRIRTLLPQAGITLTL